MNILIFTNHNYPDAKYGPRGKISFPYKTAIAFQKDNTFYALGPGNPILFRENQDSESIESWLKAAFNAGEFMDQQCEPGTYFKRIWKPTLANHIRPEDISTKEAFHQSSVSLRILLRKLNELFEIVEPNPNNLSTFGHKIRELFLLACTEVESSWSAVLREHNYAVRAENVWGTSDYVKLLNPMLLKYYAVSLRAYPMVPAFKPFENWDNTAPTQSLVWYDAYNKTKHNREGNLDKATLRNTIEAVMAAVIMHRAQFGAKFKRHWMLEGGIDDDIREMFDVDVHEIHQQIADFYVPEVIFTTDEREGRIAMPSQEWKAIEYQFT